MPESPTCPECGVPLDGDGVNGLCPRCLMLAALSDRTERPEPAASLDQSPEFAAFRWAVLDIKLVDPDEFDRFAARSSGGVPGLSQALVHAGKLTPYQAKALARGKARALAIGSYLILEKLGAGGMGVVYKARHRRLGRIVAVKTLSANLANDPELLSRFHREVDVAAKLSHPNLVSVLDADEDRGVHFMTMEYIEGKDIDRLVKERGAFPIDQALDIIIQSARGLEAAHSESIVHRDVKPANLMLDNAGNVRVLDLGLARAVSTETRLDNPQIPSLTQPGICMGTVDFMAPEQASDSRRVDHRADIYSLACTLCYVLTARPPFEGQSTISKLIAHQQEPPRSLRAFRPEIPEALDSAYLKMMAKKPGDRPASMAQVIAILEACRSSKTAASENRPIRQANVPTMDPANDKPTASARPKLTPRSSAGTPQWDELIDLRESDVTDETSADPELPELADTQRWAVPVIAVSIVSLVALITVWSTGLITLSSQPPVNSPVSPAKTETTENTASHDEPQRSSRLDLPLVETVDVQPAQVENPDPAASGREKKSQQPDPAMLSLAIKQADNPAPPPMQQPPANPPQTNPSSETKPPAVTRTPRRQWLVDASVPEFNAWVERVSASGYRPVFVNAHVQQLLGDTLGLRTSIAAIALKDWLNLPYKILSSELWDHYYSEWQSVRKSGFHMVSQAAFNNGIERGISLYVKQTNLDTSFYLWNSASLPEVINRLVRNQQRIVSIATWPSKQAWRTTFFTVSNKGIEWKFLKELSPPDFHSALVNARKEGFRPEGLFTCPLNDELRFGTVLSRDNPDLLWEVRVGLSAQELRTQHAAMASHGYAADQFVGYAVPGGSRYIACWTRDPRHYPTTGLGDPAFAAIDESIEQFLIDQQIKRATVAAFHKGSLVVSRGFGYADNEKGDPTSPDAAMALGRLSIPVMTASIRSLLSKRKVAESTTIHDLLNRQLTTDSKKRPTPTDPPGPSALTVSRLLNGLEPNAPALSSAELSEALTLLGTLAKPVANAPKLSDNQVHAALLSQVANALGAKSLADAMTTEILRPLRLKLSVDSTPATPWLPVNLAGSARDLARFFLTHQLDGRPLKPREVASHGVRVDRQDKNVALVTRRDDWLVVALLTIPEAAPKKVAEDLGACIAFALDAVRSGKN